MKKYAHILGDVLPTASAAARAADIVAALTPPARVEGLGTVIPSTAMVPTSASTVSVKEEAIKFAPGILGAVVGAGAWGEHRILGALIGHALGSNAMGLYSGDRKRALCKLGVELAAVAGALYYKKHPVVGYGLGFAAGAIATSFVDGSPASEAWAKLKAK
jgi:hypothetical protein